MYMERDTRNAEKTVQWIENYAQIKMNDNKKIIYVIGDVPIKYGLYDFKRLITVSTLS